MSQACLKNNERGGEHDYARQDLVEMETNCSGDKRNLDVTCQSAPSTPSKGEHTRKVAKLTEDEVTNYTILVAINTLATRFDLQEKKLEDLSVQMKQNCALIAGLTKASEFNAMEVKDCKTKVSAMEKELNSLQAECEALKVKSREQDRYKRRWNLRIKGMREKSVKIREMKSSASSVR